MEKNLRYFEPKRIWFIPNPNPGKVEKHHQQHTHTKARKKWLYNRQNYPFTSSCTHALYLHAHRDGDQTAPPFSPPPSPPPLAKLKVNRGDKESVRLQHVEWNVQNRLTAWYKSQSHRHESYHKQLTRHLTQQPVSPKWKWRATCSHVRRGMLPADRLWGNSLVFTAVLTMVHGCSQNSKYKQKDWGRDPAWAFSVFQTNAANCKVRQNPIPHKLLPTDEL